MHTMNPCTLGARAVLAAAALLLSGLAAPLCAQDNRPTAFTNARILPMKGAAIERGTLVVKNGKIVAVGADVAAPAGARIGYERETVRTGETNEKTKYI
jgi:cytosine/adenosine deaminase-related metal-dependent hydrolase